MNLLFRPGRSSDLPAALDCIRGHFHYSEYQFPNYSGVILSEVEGTLIQISDVIDAPECEIEIIVTILSS